MHNPKFALKNGSNHLIVDENDILYFEASGSYSKVQLNDGRIVTISKNLKEVESLLSKKFYRAHRSYLINTSCIKAFKDEESPTILLENNHSIPTTKVRRKVLFSHFKKI